MLDELVAYLQAAREAQATAWAVVVTSSEGLAAEVVQAVEGRLGKLDAVDVSSGADAREVVEEHLEKPRATRFGTTAFRGLSQVLASDQGDRFLAWLNFHREDFERSAEAFLFMVSSKDANKWNKKASDLDRYTQHFEIMDWDDLIADAEQSAMTMRMDIADLRRTLEHAEDRLERSRSLSKDLVAKSLIEVGHVALEMGHVFRAQRVVNEALLLTNERHDETRRSTVRAAAYVSSHLGRPNEALRELERLGREEADLPSVHIGLAIECFFTGQPRRALVELEKYLSQTTQSLFDAPDDPSGIVVSLNNASSIEQWLGQVRAAFQRVREASLGLPPSSKHRVAWSWEAMGSLLIDTGDLLAALDPLTKALGVSHAFGSDHLRVAVRINGSRATLDAGHPSRSLQILEDAQTSPGWKTARSYGLAAVRAEASWILSGPSAVLAVVRDERVRQKGWQAPIPAAELAYVRALASVRDDEARRCLQGAADRFRAMDGWYYLSEIERWLARLDRLEGDLDHAAARIQEGLEWHAREGLRPREARDRTEWSMIALGRNDPEAALESASAALDLIRACGTRLYEPAALVALAASEQALGHHDAASAHERRWRRLVQGIGANGLQAALERDAAWARALAKH